MVSDKAILIAVQNLQEDLLRVSGTKAETASTPTASQYILVGSVESPYIKRLFKDGKLNKKELQGKNEKYVIQTVDQPMKGVDRALVIAGSDRRGTVYGIYELSKQMGVSPWYWWMDVYGIYELSKQMGVSPWYWWMDVPVVKRTDVYAKQGSYTDGEPAVKYRGIFLNDEAPCLTSWRQAGQLYRRRTSRKIPWHLPQ